MKPTIISTFRLAVVVGVSLVSSASAVVNIAYVPVGNPGNRADYTTSYGAVAYNYRIAKNETTVGEYLEFLNAVAKADPYTLYSTSMATSRISRSGSAGSYSYSIVGSTANKPITFVSWFDAARFCNWLHNGQGSGSTETGAYSLNGAMSGIYTKNAGAITWIPSVDEWFKAAHYDATKGGSGGYWRFPTRSDALAGNTIGAPNSANFFDGDYASSPSRLTDVGAYGENSCSFYGTNDQGGNVYEWTDYVTGSSRRVIGGSAYSEAISLSTTSFFYMNPTSEYGAYGFRVASVPEPGCVVLALLAGGMWGMRRKR